MRLPRHVTPALILGAALGAQALRAEVEVHFSPDVVSILTIKGCNGSSCHGSPAGQAGFKLSLFGYDPEADHRMITNSRRVAAGDPENSLFLRKPSFAVPHGGGRVLSVDSDEYQTLRKWLHQGARLNSSGVRLEKLTVDPMERILVGAGQTLALRVTGRLSNGATRDMTGEVRYQSADESVATVSARGVLASTGRGLTTITARAMGQVATAQIGVVLARAGPEYPTPAVTNFIDELVFDKLRAMNIASYPLSGDREFIRRVFLDTIGTLPLPEEIRAFTEATRNDKRARLIDDLLERPEYASHWTVKFEDWFRNCQLNNQGRSMGVFKDWLRESLDEDRPYDAMVRRMLTSTGDNMLNPETNFWHPAADFMLKKVEVNKITPTVTRLFLGIRLECAECHNHPLENYTQDDFLGLSAFFARLRVKHGYGEYRRTWYVDEAGETEHPVKKKPVAPKFLGGETPAIPEGGDRRAALAQWITSPRNPYFARATANRIWHEYFQTGIVEPFDDFRSTNMPTNPRLLDRLADAFVEGGYRLKPLHRLILNSRVYQLSSRDPGRTEDPGRLERLLFTRYEPRKLPAEVLLDSIGQVTGVPHSFRGYPAGTSAKDIYVPDAPDYFLVTFGFPRRDILGDRVHAPTLSQALHMMNGDTIRQKVEVPSNILEGAKDNGILDLLYERAYARPPSETERRVLARFLETEQAAGRTRRRALENLLWSVLNSKEFQLNH